MILDFKFQNLTLISWAFSFYDVIAFLRASFSPYNQYFLLLEPSLAPSRSLRPISTIDTALVLPYSLLEPFEKFHLVFRANY